MSATVPFTELLLIRWIPANIIGPVGPPVQPPTASFRDTASADMSFASNLLGAMVGGALEYLSMVTGYRALLLVAAALYGLAMLLGTRVRLLGDAEIEPKLSRTARGPRTQAAST